MIAPRATAHAEDTDATELLVSAADHSCKKPHPALHTSPPTSMWNGACHLRQSCLCQQIHGLIPSIDILPENPDPIYSNFREGRLLTSSFPLPFLEFRLLEISVRPATADPQSWDCRSTRSPRDLLRMRCSSSQAQVETRMLLSFAEPVYWFCLTLSSCPSFPSCTARDRKVSEILFPTRTCTRESSCTTLSS